MAFLRSVFAPGLFTGRSTVVTGGATGIGAAIAHELCHLGCNVMLASRSESKLDEAVKIMKNNEALTGDVSSVQCNIRQEEQVKNLMQVTMERFGRIDYLVNNGGGQFPSLLENMSAKGWNAVIDTNLTGTSHCCKHAYLEWMKNNGGAIVNIITNLKNGLPIAPHTAAARAAVGNLTKTLALDWAKDCVRVNAIAPGFIYSKTAAANYSDPKFLEKFIPLVPPWRLGNPEEISSAVCFLLSPAATYVSGESMYVDGGSVNYNRHFKLAKPEKFTEWSWEEPDL